MQDTPASIRIFKALSDENRMRILEQIQNATLPQVSDNQDCKPEDACVTNIAEVLGITAATTSHHIKELVNAGLIITTKKGRWVYCRINHDVLAQTLDYLKRLGKEGL